MTGAASEQTQARADITVRVSEIRQENQAGDVSYRDIEWLTEIVFTLLAVLAAAVRREEQLREALARLADEIDELSLWEPGRAGYAAAHGRLLAELGRARAALADVGGEQQGSDDECICSRLSDLPDGTIIADLTCPVHGVEGSDPGDVLPGAVSRGDKPT